MTDRAGSDLRLFDCMNVAKVCLSVVLALAGFACTDADTGEVTLVSGGQQGVAIPPAVRAVAVPENGTLEADLYCAGNDAQEMKISGGFARGSCTGMSTTGEHTIRVDFVFSPAGSNERFVIARATATGLRVETAGTKHVFAPAAFDTSIDDDGDLVSNLDELAAGADPRRAICFIGVSLIGHCEL